MLMTDHRWYAIQTTAGHENKVRSLIARKIDQDGRPQPDRPIRQALVPTQEVVEIKNGKKVTVERKLYPGDYNRAEPGTGDQLVWSGTGCTCVLITSTKDVLR